MNRRTFLLTPAVAAGALNVQPKRAADGAVADPNRRVYELNRKWKYSPNNAKWERVTLPHSNVTLPWHSFDEKDFQFVSHYRRHFLALPGWQGKRVFVDFGGVMTAAKVSINGHTFEEYKGGYTPFSFELTP
jgi:beta-galactosidase